MVYRARSTIVHAVQEQKLVEQGTTPGGEPAIYCENMQ